VCCGNLLKICSDGIWDSRWTSPTPGLPLLMCAFRYYDYVRDLFADIRKKLVKPYSISGRRSPRCWPWLGATGWHSSNVSMANGHLYVSVPWGGWWYTVLFAFRNKLISSEVFYSVSLSAPRMMIHVFVFKCWQLYYVCKCCRWSCCVFTVATIGYGVANYICVREVWM